MINEALQDLYFEYVDRKFAKHNLNMMVEDGRAAWPPGVQSVERVTRR